MIPRIKVDYANPNYDEVYTERLARLERIREEAARDPNYMDALKAYYRDNPADFIDDWGATFDPRNIEIGRSAVVPFILFPKQREWIEWLLENWRDRRPGLTEKSRDCGASWVAVALGCTMCLHYRGMVIGYGSRKENYVDEINNPKSLFFKARMFMQEIPVDFRGGWLRHQNAAHMRITFPQTGSAMTGEAGDNIGRGDRTSMYFVDESAFLERPQLVEASLSATTNCRQDVSTPNGRGNPFEQKRHGGKVRVFTFHWRNDPRKDDAWYAKQLEDLTDVVVAQEIDINYSASVEGVLIPHPWIMAAIDACEKLGIKPTGKRAGGLDVADEGIDLNAFCGATGVQMDHLEEWSGKGSDIMDTVRRSFAICDRLGYSSFTYDGDGLGAGVRGDARTINDERKKGGVPAVQVQAFRATAPVVNPEAEDVKGRKNEDFFANFNAQSWWSVRMRFQRTYRWVHDNIRCANDDIISIPTKIPHFIKLIGELSQPTYALNNAGKVVVDKKPEGARSPNLADAVKIRFASPGTPPMLITPDIIAKSRLIGGGLRRR